jgi:hypothetical protein
VEVDRVVVRRVPADVRLAVRLVLAAVRVPVLAGFRRVVVRLGAGRWVPEVLVAIAWFAPT